MKTVIVIDAKYETKEEVDHYFRHQISNKDQLTHLYFTTHSDALDYLESNHEQVKLYIVYISQATEIEYLKKLRQLEVCTLVISDSLTLYDQLGELSYTKNWRFVHPISSVPDYQRLKKIVYHAVLHAINLSKEQVRIDGINFEITEMLYAKKDTRQKNMARIVCRDYTSGLLRTSLKALEDKEKGWVKLGYYVININNIRKISQDGLKVSFTKTTKSIQIGRRHKKTLRDLLKNNGH
ncbi:LytTR family transcriptional regulator DNA-binding domain-containing protein [Lactococcus sp.]|uniref:LytTR family transcriptional regulator DNA-binding domain-containing protein n=1 Tax=Lactococcus sp. TaxID=44273 RepID=UPI0035B30903